MYGGLSAFPEGKNDNKYYVVAREKPSPLTDRFDEAHFNSFFDGDTAGLSLKALLATEQRIPGLGNGVLQDVLFNARMHPKRKAGTLSADDRRRLFESVKSTLSEMVAAGGRDTENDLFGRPGGYVTRLSRNTAGQPCPVCGAADPERGLHGRQHLLLRRVSEDVGGAKVGETGAGWACVTRMASRHGMPCRLLIETGVTCSI